LSTSSTTGSTTGFAWIVPDLHGNVVAQCGASGNLTDVFRYDAYGNLIGNTMTSGVASPWRFQGRILESTAGSATYDFGARAYVPDLGTFTSLDSLVGSAQNPMTLNRYLYADANPATMVDPDGHCSWDTVSMSCVGENANNDFNDKNAARAELWQSQANSVAERNRDHVQQLQDAKTKLQKQLDADQATADDNQRRMNTLVWAKTANEFAIGVELLGFLPTFGADGEEITESADDYAANDAELQAIIDEIPALGQAMSAEQSNIDDLTSTLANYGARGNDFAAGSTRGSLSDEEQATASYLAEKYGVQVDKIPEQNGPGQSNIRTPDVMVRTSGGDPGTVAEIKNITSDNPETVTNALSEKSKQLGASSYGTGNVVIDARGSGLTRESALQGLNTQLRYGLGNIQQVLIILDDGSDITYP
jgi:RHS repeat-associated protein